MSKLDELEKLGELKTSGAITEQEFEHLKQEVLNKSDTSQEKVSISSNTDFSSKVEQKTEPFAVVSFAAGIGGFLILPILFVPIGYISAIISYYRLKENKNLKGTGLRVSGALFTTANILWLMYQFRIGPFNY